MRTRKEDQIILKGEQMLIELNNIYFEGIAIDSYKKLLIEYKKLYKRYEKTIKVSDNIENSIMQKNDSLNNNLEYTIKIARDKLFKNIKEHRKTKEALFNYKQEIDQHKDVLGEILTQKMKIQNKLRNYEQNFGEINHEFLAINKEEIQNISLEEVLSLAFIAKDKQYTLIKLKLKEFQRIQKLININSSIKSFIQKVQKFIKNNLPKDSIIYYQKEGIFYLGLINTKDEDIQELINRLNDKRDLYNIEISFNSYISKLEKTHDCIPELINRCNLGLNKIINENLGIKEK